MSERDRNRQIVERMAERIKEHNYRQGKNMTAGEAQKQAAEVARTTDAKRDAGDHKRRGK